MRFTAEEIAAATGGRVVGPPAVVDGASFDSRSLRPGQLFVPVVAERNGHGFVPAAVAAGAAVYLTAQGPIAGAAAATAVEVADTAAAFTALGAAARDRLGELVVGVTGSVGKTSVKDLTAAALGGRYRTAASEKSFNNDLGLPHTLVNAADGTQAAVLEMGMRGFGEIARLCRVGRPTIGIVTVIGYAHVELVGSIEGVAQAKGELPGALPASGTAVLNADDHRCIGLAARTAARVLGFGIEAGDVRATRVVLDELARPSFELATPWGRAAVRLGQSGRHMAANAAAAAAAALAAGVPLEAAVAGLEQAQLSPWRMELGRSLGGAVVVNDAYNANPTSMRAALDALAALPVTGRRVAVLGVMAELGPDGPAQHAELGAWASEHGITVVAVGTPWYGIAPVADAAAALDAIGALGSADAVLVKASRVAGLERLAAQLLAR
ncbi:MAG: UDP-N-acetylmuramoyl-tripeptide--D-alanyl-D-alanine ligase [Acidimicrobiales bacterium]